MPSRLNIILFLLAVSRPVYNLKQEMHLAGSICTQYDPCRPESKNGQCCGCSCDLECRTVGNCCYGDMGVVTDGKLYGSREYLTSNKELCMKPLITGGLPRRWSKSYLFVKICADNYTGLDRMWCESESITIETLTPVYGNQTGLNYANVYCAECNFISRDDTLPWKPIIKCEEDFDILSVTDDEISFLEKLQTSPGCALTWSQPEDRVVKDCILDIDIIKSCDPEIITSSFSSEFTNITDLCQDSPFLLYSSSQHSYKNPYCFLCNNERVYFSDVDCRPFVYNRYDYLAPLSFTLDFTRMKSKSKSKSRNELDLCDGELDYNAQLNRCLNYTCPPSFAERSGICLPLILVVKNVILDFRLKLRYKNISTFPSTEEVITTLFHLTKSHFDVNNGTFDYEYLEHSIIDPKTVEYRTKFFWEVVSNVIPFLEYLTLQESLKRWENDSLSIALDDNVSFQALNVDKSMYFEFNNDNLYTGRHKLKIAMHHLQFCDAFLIPPDDYEFQDSYLLSGQGRFSASEYVIRPTSRNRNGFAHVCRDIYEDRVQQMESDFSVSAGPMNPAISSHLVDVLTLVCTILSQWSVL